MLLKHMTVDPRAAKGTRQAPAQSLKREFRVMKTPMESFDVERFPTGRSGKILSSSSMTAKFNPMMNLILEFVNTGFE